MTVDLTNPIFHDEDAARRHFEAMRWPDGPICPHCGSVNNATELKPGFPGWIGLVGPKAAEMLVKPPASSFTRRVRQDSAT
jgi:hypothetical protein